MADSRACCPAERCLIKPQSMLDQLEAKKMKTYKQSWNSQLGKKEKENKHTNKHQHIDLLERYLMKPWFMVIGQWPTRWPGTMSGLLIIIRDYQIWKCCPIEILYIYVQCTCTPFWHGSIYLIPISIDFASRWCGLANTGSSRLALARIDPDNSFWGIRGW